MLQSSLFRFYSNQQWLDWVAMTRWLHANCGGKWESPLNLQRHVLLFHGCFEVFYEKALLNYERHKTRGGELSVPVSSLAESMNVENQASGSGRAWRDDAAWAMQGWHSQSLLGSGEVGDPIIKDKSSISLRLSFFFKESVMVSTDSRASMGGYISSQEHRMLSMSSSSQ